MKTIHLLIALLALNGLYAQSGQVEYSVKRDSILYPIPEKHKERFYGMTKYANNQTFKSVSYTHLTLPTNREV